MHEEGYYKKCPECNAEMIPTCLGCGARYVCTCCDYEERCSCTDYE